MAQFTNQPISARNRARGLYFKLDCSLCSHQQTKSDVVFSRLLPVVFGVNENSKKFTSFSF